MTPPWLESLLADPGVTDICLNGALGAYADRGRGPEPVTDARWHEEGLKTWVLARLSEAGRGWDARHPFADAALTSGHRLHAVFPPVARTGVHVSLRRLPTPGPPRWSASPLFDTLSEAVRRGESVLISGATGSGKTTLLTDLLAEIPADERILALEDTPELAPRHPHFVSLTSRPANADGCGEVTLRALLRQALRMRPDRIVLGECRGPEVLDLLQALNTGHRGAMATLHASSPREAIKRVELLCLLASPVPLPALRELLALGIRWVAQVERRGPGRVISELWRVEGREGETILMRPLSGHPDRPALI